MNSLWPNGRIRLMVSGVCNAHCQHCHNEGIKATSHFMHRRIVDLFAEIASQQNDPFDRVTFSGGEPLLHPSIVEFCKVISSSSSGITISTNGRLLNNGKINELASSGVSRIRIDVDPWRFEWGRDSNLNMNEIIDRVNNLRETGIQVALNTVLTYYTVKQLRGLLLLCEKYCLSVKIFERATRLPSSGFLMPNPDVPFTVLEGIVNELYPSTSYSFEGHANGDVLWRGMPFQLRYCRLLCATGRCKMSGIRCAPDGRLAVCVNRFGSETINVSDSPENVLKKIKGVVRETCMT